MKTIYLALSLINFNYAFCQEFNFEKIITSNEGGDTIIEHWDNYVNGSFFYTTKSNEPFSGYATSMGKQYKYKGLMIIPYSTYDIIGGRLTNHRKTYWIINSKDTVISQDIYYDPYHRNYSLNFTYFNGFTEYIQNHKQQISRFEFYDYSIQFKMSSYFLYFNTKKSEYIITKKILKYCGENKKEKIKNKWIFSEKYKFRNLSNVIEYFKNAIVANREIFEPIKDKLLSCPFRGVTK